MDSVEPGLADQPLVGDAVEGNAAGVAQPGEAGTLAQALGEAEHAVLERRLHRGREVLVGVAVVGPAPLPGEHRRHRVAEVEAPCVVHREEALGRDRRRTVGREAHHLARLHGVAEDLARHRRVHAAKAAEARHARAAPREPGSARHQVLFEHLDRRAMRPVKRGGLPAGRVEGAGPLLGGKVLPGRAHAIDDEHGGLVVARRGEGAGGMAEVVGDDVDGNAIAQAAELRVGGDGVGRRGGRGLGADYYRGQIGRGDARMVEAVAQREAGPATPDPVPLFATEALFLDGDGDSATAHQTGRAIVRRADAEHPGSFAHGDCAVIGPSASSVDRLRTIGASEGT